MSESENKIVKNYINQIKQKLPEWLKWKEVEFKDLLDDLEAQLYGEARSISGEEELTDADIEEAIRRIGTPESIARLYKNRGKPKFYLTQELFGFYLRTLCLFFVVIIFINIVTAVFKFFFIVWWEVLGVMFSGIWIGCLIATIIITIVFVYFSMEGFLPEDFGTIPNRLAIIFPFNFTERYIAETSSYTKQHIEKAKILGKEKLAAVKARVEERIAESKVLREERRAEAKLYRKQRLEEARALKKQRLEYAKQKRLSKKKKQPISISELILGISAGLLFGLFLIIQPFSVTGLMVPAFLDWLKLFGYLILIGALLDLIRLVIGVSNYTGQQVFLIIGAFFNLAYIPVFLMLLNQPEIFPISLFSGGNIPIIPYDPSNITYIVYFWVIIVIIISIIGGMIGNFLKVGKYSKLKRAY